MKLVADRRRATPRRSELPFAGEYEALLAAATPDYDFPDFDENTRATTFYTTGTTGLPKGVYFSHRQLVLHTLAPTARSAHAPQALFTARTSTCRSPRCFTCTPGAFPTWRPCSGVKQVYPGRYVPDALLRLIKTRERHLLPLCADHPADDAEQPGGGQRGPLPAGR